MRFDRQIFGDLNKSLLDPSSQFVFVADMFSDDYVGGAELTLAALIEAFPEKVERVRSRDLTLNHVDQGASKYWIFGNYSELNPQLIPAIVARLRYNIVECDFKFCRFRSPEKHLAAEGTICDCANSQHGKFIVNFMSGADCIWWMSEKQRDAFWNAFPHLMDYPQKILSSVFDRAFFAQIEALRARSIVRDDKWLILRSNSWIKGTDDSIDRARRSGRDFELIEGLSPSKLLERMSRAKGLMFHPKGADTCPRLVIEAKLLGCELDVNENVLHADETWFATADVQDTIDHLKLSPQLFRREVLRMARREWTLSGYSTTYDCIRQRYPFVESIESLLRFCDEVVVVDGGSTDGTLERLASLQARWPISDTEESCREPFEDPTMPNGASLTEAQREAANGLSKLKVHVVPRDWNDPRSALFDGQQKAEARARCTGDFVWQSDVDEIVRHEDRSKVRDLVANFPKAIPMIVLPIVEYWGSTRKIRLDVTPWKWRLSRNSPRITHGIPIHLRATDPEGRLIARPGTDGCDPICAVSGEPIPFLGFLTPEMETRRQAALRGDPVASRSYEEWFEKVVTNVPSVYHVSWLDIERKIELYRDFWSRHWNVLNGEEHVDDAEHNMFFDKPWSEVTAVDIGRRAAQLRELTGGWIFHSKWRGERVPHMTMKNVSIPREITGLEVTTTGT